MAQRPGVLFSVSSLGFGGAEKHTIALLNHLDTAVFRLALQYLKPDESLLPQLDISRLDAVLCSNVRRKLDWRALNELAAFIDRHAIDVIVCTNAYPALYARLAALRSQRRVALVEVFHTTLLQTFKDKLQMRLYRALFRAFDLLVYVSGNQQAHWRARGLRARNDCVIHNGIDVEAFTDRFTPWQKAALRAEHGFAADDYVIGICAALRPEKAHGDLLQALARVRAKGIAAKALIIGDGPERTRIDSLIDALQLRGAVAITGFKTDVRPYIASCDVLTLVSHSVETFSLAVLEAMALGKPLVLTRVGGADEQVAHGENGLLYEAGDIDALAEHLITLSDSQIRAGMGAAGLARVHREFTESQMIRNFSQVLGDLVQAVR